MTYSYNPDGAWTSRHQMTLNGKRDDFDLEDFRLCARTAAMKRGRAETILGEVQAVVANWNDYALQADIPVPVRRMVQNNLRTI